VKSTDVPPARSAFARLPPDVRDVVLRTAEEIRLRAGEVLFRQNDAGQSMYAIEEGELRILFENGEKPKLLGPGQFLGEISLLAPGVNRTATAVAETDCSLRVISQQTLDQLKIERPELLCSLLQETCAYLVVSERNLLDDLTKRNSELEHTLDYLRRTREELEATDLLAQTDELTRLYNRRCLNLQLPKFMQRAEASGNGLAVLLVDVDRFKPINDTHGHGAGDLVLREMAQLFKSRTRKTDLLCRIGGDEFAILLGDTQEMPARDRASDIQRSVADLAIHMPGAVLAVTVSMGGTMFRPGDKPGTLIKRADESLYIAKDNGRNRLAWMGQLIAKIENVD
jgi:diguanylate cyclase (GGDEF)-like protein